MNNFTDTGLIILKDEVNIEYAICRLDYTLCPDSSFKYVFTPYYDVIDLLNSNVFQGIPGLDLSLRKKEYIRENIIPVFISERVPSENREDYYDLLAEAGLKFMDPIRYLINTKYQYSGDNFYMSEFKERKSVTLEDELGKCNTLGTIKKILNGISHGDQIFLKNRSLLNDKKVFETLKFIYSKSFKKMKSDLQKGIELAKSKNKYKGRKPLSVDKLFFLEQSEAVSKGTITLDQALKSLNISKATYYRLKKRFI